MFTRNIAYEKVCRCEKCGSMYDRRKACVNCAIAYMRLWTKVQDAIDLRNYEWAHNVPTL